MSSTTPDTTTPEQTTTPTIADLAALIPQSIANRVAAVGAFLTGLAAAVAGTANALPTAWQSTVLAVVGVIGAIGTLLHFMLGAQKSEANSTQLALAVHDVYTANLENQNQLLSAQNAEHQKTIEQLTSPVQAKVYDQEATTEVDDETMAAITDPAGFQTAEHRIDTTYSPAFAGHPNPDDQPAAVGEDR